MIKMDFATAYNPIKQIRSIMDQRDNVNRVSYVDATTYVQRMILEGRNLTEFRAKAMRSGLYSSEDAMYDLFVPPMPVYDPDPVIRDQTTKVYVDALNYSIKSKQDIKVEEHEKVQDVVSDKFQVDVKKAETAEKTE